MGSSEVLRTRLSLGIGFHEETTEIGNQSIDLLRLFLPPFHHIGIDGISRIQTANLDGGCEIDREIDADAIWAQHVGNAPHLMQVVRCQRLRLCVHIVKHRAIDAHRGTSACVHLHSCRIGILEDTLSCKATLHRAIGIVPVVQDAQVVGRFLADVERSR